MLPVNCDSTNVAVEPAVGAVDGAPLVTVTVLVAVPVCVSFVQSHKPRPAKARAVAAPPDVAADAPHSAVSMSRLISFARFKVW